MKKQLSEEHRRNISAALRGRVKAKNITGRKFGKWTVLRPAPKRLRSTEAFWECKCECGTLGQVSSHRLQQGKSKGCLSCQKRKRPFESMYNTLCSSAVARSIPFELTYEELVKFTEVHTCHYCEAVVLWAKFGTDRKASHPYNLDRRDNEKGYLIANLVVCCKVCNKVKSDYFSYEEMIEIGKTIRGLRQRTAAKGA